MHVVVLVLGDIGRSPRMQYHALSLASEVEVKKVTLVGYEGERVISSLESHLKVTIDRVKLPTFLNTIPLSILRVFSKGFALLWAVLYLLVCLPRYQVILIQNPPCLPALMIAFIISIFNGSSIILDWHNLGYTIFQQTFKSKGHPLVKLTAFCEHYLCRIASYHICVSKALRLYLQKNCGVSNAVVVHDCPSSIFTAADNNKAMSISQRNDFLKLLKINTTMKSNKTALIVSGTSWTADEDFSILLNALVKLESILNSTKLTKECKFDSLLCVVTGKGDLKSFYEAEMIKLRSTGQLGRKVDIQTAWLAIEDYPRLLAAADLGISLHSSSSGLDLPMKVLDMFGSGLPALALSFPAIGELVIKDHNGSTFVSFDDLSQQLNTLLFSQPGQETLSRWRENVQQIERWETNWQRTMRPVVLEALNIKS